MRQLHCSPSTAAMAPHILLEEIGAPFELVWVDTSRQAHKSAEYLRLNPNGTIPAFVDGDLVLYESAAICLHLADSAPGAQLMPAFGTAARAHCTKWLVWMTNTLQANLMSYFYPERWVEAGNAEGVAQVRSCAERRIGPMLAQLDAELARHGGPWLMGADYTVADPFCLMLCRWTRNFSATPPARDWPHLGPYLRRMLERPAVQRVFVTEKLPQPLV